VEWLEVKALSSSPSTTKKKKRKEKKKEGIGITRSDLLLTKLADFGQ
jgi:hypothetical protein